MTRLCAGTSCHHVGKPHWRDALEQKRVESGLAAVEVWSQQMELLASATDPHFPDGELGHPMEPVLEQAIAGVQELLFETTSFGNLMLIATPITSTSSAAVPKRDAAHAIVVAYRIIPRLVVAKAEAIVSSLEDYRQLKAFKNPIKTSYIVSFAVIAMAILFLGSLVRRLSRSAYHGTHRKIGRRDQGCRCGQPWCSY